MRADVIDNYPAGIPEGIFLIGDLRLGTLDAHGQGREYELPVK